MENAHRYAETILGGDGLLITFNDTQPWLNGWVVACAAGSEFDRPLLRWLADHEARVFAAGPTEPEQDRGLFAVAAFLLRDRRPAPDRFPGLPTLSVLESTCEGVMRSEGDRLVPRLLTGVKGNGKFNTHHANADQGSFVLHANGEAYLIDPGYFEGKAAQHSLPLIGDHTNLIPTAFAPIQDAWEKGDVRSMTVDATAAHGANAKDKHPASAKSVRRVFVQAGERALVVLDDVVPNDPGAVIHTRFQVGQPLVVKGSQAVLTGAKGTVTITTDGPAIAFTATPREFAKNGSVDWVFGKSGVPWQTLEGTYPADPAKPLITVFAPAKIGEQPANVTITRSGAGLTVNIGGTAVEFTRLAKGWSAVEP
jgi:hypothetical protein